MKTKHLVFLDGFIWLAAGLNVVNLGVRAWQGLEGTGFWLVVGCVLTMGAFGTMFVRMVFKNVERLRLISAERRHVWNCMSLRSFLIMAFMIGLGVTLRHSPQVPRGFIAFFYVGLGTALSAAGVVYLALPFCRKALVEE